MKQCCVVIPVYNSPYIKEVIEDVLQYGYRIVVVDDGSDVKLELDVYDIELVVHERNLGKGAAILSGAREAKALGFEEFVTFDADKQHIGSEIEKLLRVHQKGSIVIGNRDFNAKNVPESSKFGRKFSNFWVLLETFKRLGDTQSGLRIYPVDILDLGIRNRRYDFEIEVLALHAYRGGSFIDVEVACYYPPHEERVSHFDKFRDNARLSLAHTKLMIQRYLLLRGLLWR